MSKNVSTLTFHAIEFMDNELGRATLLFGSFKEVVS